MREPENYVGRFHGEKHICAIKKYCKKRLIENRKKGIHTQYMEMT